MNCDSLERKIDFSRTYVYVDLVPDASSSSSVSISRQAID